MVQMNQTTAAWDFFSFCLGKCEECIEDLDFSTASFETLDGWQWCQKQNEKLLLPFAHSH